MLDLKEATFESDIHSIVKVINFILGGHPEEYNHECRYLTEISTSQDINSRFADGKEFYQKYSNFIKQKNNIKQRENILKEIIKGQFSNKTNTFLVSLNAEEFSDFLAEETNSTDAIMHLFRTTPNLAKDELMDLQEGIKKGYPWKQYDKFSSLAYQVLLDRENFSYEIKIIAAQLLDYTVHNKNRFHAQRLIEELKDVGIDPTLEEIITKN